MEHLEFPINTTVKRRMTTPGWKDDCCVWRKKEENRFVNHWASD
jgi:hypothetical protein